MANRRITQEIRIPASRLDAGCYQRMWLGRRLWSASIEKIPDTLPHRAMAQQFIGCMEERLKGGYGLLLHGPHGTGKTALAAILMREAYQRGAACLILPASDLTDAFFGADYNEEKTVRCQMETVDLLVLDDVGSEHCSEFSKSAVERIFRYRYHDKSSTILTTNVSLDTLWSRMSSGFQDLVMAVNTLVEVDGVAWREREMAAAGAFGAGKV